MERGGFYFPYQHNDNDIPAKCRQGDDLLFCALFPQNSGCSSLMCGGKLFIIECMNWDNQFSPKHIIQILTLQTLQTGNGFYFRTGLKCLFIELAADYVSISRNNEKIIGCYSWCVQCFTFERFRKCSTSFSKSRCCNSSSNQTSLTSVHLWLVLLKNGNNFSWHQSFGHLCEWCWYAILLHLVQFWKQFGDQWKCAGLKIRN